MDRPSTPRLVGIVLRGAENSVSMRAYDAELGHGPSSTEACEPSTSPGGRRTPMRRGSAESFSRMCRMRIVIEVRKLLFLIYRL